jgi:hypothetical protein
MGPKPLCCSSFCCQPRKTQWVESSQQTSPRHATLLLRQFCQPMPETRNSVFCLLPIVSAFDEKPQTLRNRSALRLLSAFCLLLSAQGLGSTERLTVVDRVTVVLLPSAPMSVSLKTPAGVPTGAGLISF